MVIVARPGACFSPTGTEIRLSPLGDVAIETPDIALAAPPHPPLSCPVVLLDALPPLRGCCCLPLACGDLFPLRDAGGMPSGGHRCWGPWGWSRCPPHENSETLGTALDGGVLDGTPPTGRCGVHSDPFGGDGVVGGVFMPWGDQQAI